MKNKDRIIFGFIFCWWVVLVGLLLTLTWPPTMAFVLIWLACGLTTTSVYAFEAFLGPKPQDLTKFVYWTWFIWLILGTISILVCISMGWYKYHTSGLYPGKTIR